VHHAAACSLSGNPLILLAAIPIGILIGLLGVGGILLVPLLSLFGGCSEHQAIGLSLASFVALGAISAFVRLRAGWRPDRGEWLLFGMMIPGAVLGAFVGAYLPDIVLRLAVAIAVAATGAWTLAPRPRAVVDGAGPGPPRLAAVGIASGMMCALTGAGGPVVVMPMLLVQGVAVREALAISQVAQLPIAATATLTRSLAGGIAAWPAAILGVCLMLGFVAGMRLSGIVRAAVLQRIVGWSLLAAGVAMFALAFRR
jgi:uncharacterized membrane protein YfcA